MWQITAPGALWMLYSSKKMVGRSMRETFPQVNQLFIHILYLWAPQENNDLELANHNVHYIVDEHKPYN